MNKPEYFEELKNDVIKKFLVYLEKIKCQSLDDLDDMKKYCSLIEAFSHATISHTEYREFVWSFRKLLSAKKVNPTAVKLITQQSIALPEEVVSEVLVLNTTV